MAGRRQPSRRSGRLRGVRADSPAGSWAAETAAQIPRRSTRLRQNNNGGGGTTNNGNGNGNGNGFVLANATRVIANFNRWTPYTYRGQSGFLVGMLAIMTDPVLTSRTKYQLSFYFSTNTAAQNEALLGVIDSWRVQRPNIDDDNLRASDPWVRELLRPSGTALTRRRSFKETAYCLKAVYTQQGNLKVRLNGNPSLVLRNRLDIGDVMFTELVWIDPQRQRQGLLRPILQMYRTLLRQAPGAHAFEDMILLVPGAPEGGPGNEWPPNVNVPNVLTGIYRKSDAYASMVQNVKVGSVVTLSVMGRSV